MKRLLVSLTALAALFVACQPAEEEEKSICTNNDADCDGVPDDLGVAVDQDGYPGPDLFDYNGDGTADGYAVDTTCDGVPNALGLDTNNDGYVDAVELNPGGTPQIITTGDPGATFSCSTPLLPSAGGSPGDGDGSGSGGSGNPPPPPPGQWYAPVVGAAAGALNAEYTSWKNRYVKTDCGGGKISVKNGLGGAYSEGIGYGMLIMANLGTQAEFDGIWTTYREAPKSSGGLMQWKCDECVTSCPESNGSSASDGDIDAAMALLQAEVRWGGGAYLEAGRQLIATIRAAVLRNCNGVVHLTPGEWDPGCAALNPSYYSPGYYKVFATIDTLGSGVWLQAIDSAYDSWTASMGMQNPAGTQQISSIWPDGLGNTCFSCNGYDGCRVPWRIAIDYAWTGEQRAQSLLNTVSTMIDTNGMQTYTGNGNNNSAFLGALALSGLAVSQAKADQHYNTWLSSNPSDQPYYQSTLRVVYHLLAGGAFPSGFELAAQ